MLAFEFAGRGAFLLEFGSILAEDRQRSDGRGQEQQQRQDLSKRHEKQIPGEVTLTSAEAFFAGSADVFVPNS